MRNKLMVILISLLLVSCGDDDQEEEAVVEIDPAIAEAQLAVDIDLIEDYLSTNNLTAEVHESGLRYIVVDEGGGARPLLRNTIIAAFVGTFLDGEVFDSSNNFEIQLSSLIEAWQIGLPLIRSGGEIHLYVPSALGYGPNGNSSGIPGNTVLIFEISLVGVD